MEFQDYYKTLGIAKTATPKEIQTAYRKLARKLHPDVNKDPDAESRFKAINEAYEVLKDPEKRKKYDQLGANWREGEAYSPPPGWENVVFHYGDEGGFDFTGGNPGQFSEFFESLFGGRSRRNSRRGGTHAYRDGGFAMRGADQEGVLELALEEVYHGGKHTLHLNGRDISVNIQPGTLEGTRLRLAGQGSPGIGGGPAGDLFLKVKLLPHSRYQVDGADLTFDLLLTPWEAALGTKVELDTLGGSVTLTVPPGVQSGQKLRLKGKGLPQRGGSNGNLFAMMRIMVPRQLSDRELELMEELARVSTFNPRQA